MIIIYRKHDSICIERKRNETTERCCYYSSGVRNRTGSQSWYSYKCAIISKGMYFKRLFQVQQTLSDGFDPFVPGFGVNALPCQLPGNGYEKAKVYTRCKHLELLETARAKTLGLLKILKMEKQCILVGGNIFATYIDRQLKCHNICVSQAVLYMSVNTVSSTADAGQSSKKENKQNIN